MSEFEISQIGAEVWWVRQRTKIGDRVEFDGNAFQGPNAERLAREWAALKHTRSTGKP